ncbi:MAG: HYR domain-containing protein [Saprospiraceae bacterium]
MILFLISSLVSYAANTSHAEATSCVLSHTVNDDCTVPSFTACPGNFVVNTSSGVCNALVNYSAVASGIPEPTYTYVFTGTTIASGSGTGTGSAFDKGVTNVVVTATNDCGTTTCTFTVTVNDNQPPTITCPPNATLSANASCLGTLVAYSAVSLSDNCNPSPTMTQSPASGTLLFGHNTARIVTLTANDGNGNTSSCTFTVTLKDVTPPSIACPPNATVNANASCQGSVGVYNAASLSDNCNPSPTVTQSPALGTLLTGHNSTQILTLTANDGNGNTSTCTFNVTLKDITPPSIACPPNATVNANASCQGSIGVYSAATLSDNCNPSPTVTQSPSSGTLLTGHNSTQILTLTANDGNGNTSSCTFTVTLKDVTPPSITCPSSITVNNNGTCTAVVNYAMPVGLDNCIGQITSQTAGLTSGSNFPIGTTTNTFQVTDQNGSTATCSFTVVVSGEVTYTYNGTCYETLSAALAAAAMNNTFEVLINANANPNEINTIPNGVTVRVLAGAMWTNTMMLKNNGTIILENGASFINAPGGVYKGIGGFNDNFQNMGGVISPGD